MLKPTLTHLNAVCVACLHFVNCIVQYLIYLRRQERRQPKLLPISCYVLAWLVVCIHEKTKELLYNPGRSTE